MFIKFYSMAGKQTHIQKKLKQAAKNHLQKCLTFPSHIFML